jgi:hypothetical protein
MITRRLIFIPLLLLMSCSLVSNEPVSVSATPPALATDTPLPPTAVPTSTRAATAVPTLLPTDTQVPATLAPTFTPEPAEVVFPFTFPIPPRPIDSVYRFATDYNGKLDPNHGVEISASTGSIIQAVADGRVVFVGDDTNGSEYGPSGWFWFYGNFIILEHDVPATWPVEGVENLFTLYAHLSVFDVELDQEVTAGQKIGEVGATGVAGGSLLHFEVRVNGSSFKDARNPELFMQPYDGNGTLVGTLKNADGFLFYDFPLEVRPVGADSHVHYFSTYLDYRYTEQMPFNESFVIGNLPEGTYELAFIASGLQAFPFEIFAGQITRLDITLGN